MFQPAVSEWSLALQVHLFALGSTRLKLLPVFGNEMDNRLDNVFEEWPDFSYCDSGYVNSKSDHFVRVFNSLSIY